jgi:hypothetical protein
VFLPPTVSVTAKCDIAVVGAAPCQWRSLQVQVTLQAQLKDKDAKGWTPTTVKYSRVAVLVMELERRAQYRPELSQVLEDLPDLEYLCTVQ